MCVRVYVCICVLYLCVCIWIYVFSKMFRANLSLKSEMSLLKILKIELLFFKTGFSLFRVKFSIAKNLERMC